MMYKFCDTTQAPSGSSLPSEAICYDGVWIDEDISQYRTLYVSGRESFNADIAELALESMDGSVFLRRRLLPRTITVGYQISASTAGEMMRAYNRLNKLMRGAQVQIIFADEPDKYYVGTCRTIGVPEPGRLTVKSEMEIYCPDPCKYSTEETVVVPNGSGVFPVEYAGSYPARPTFKATLKTSGDGKIVSFVSGEAMVRCRTPFTKNTDFVIINCANGKTYLNGEYDATLGDIENQYENMLLVPGSNLITPSAAGTMAYTYEMTYREAWL